MKATIQDSGRIQRRDGSRPYVNIALEPENEAERAVLRMAYSGKRTMLVWSAGNATVQITMPRGKNEC